jgi:hypothetical protein
MDKKFLFKVAGPSNTTGYFNITIPTILLEGNPWTVKLNGTDVTQQVTISKNQTHASVYLAYEHSSRDIQLIGTSVIPEYQLPCILALMILLTAMFAFILKTGSKRRLEPSIDKC